MKRYSIYQIPVLSFFSKNMYRYMASDWKGTGFAYLLLLLIICWIITLIKVHVQVGNFIDNEASQIISQVPVITIAGGDASIKESQPYYIKDPDTGKDLIIIDTTGKITSLDNSEALALIKKTEVVFKKDEFETRTISFEKFGDFTLDQALLNKIANIVKKSLAAVFFLFAVLGSFVFRIVQALIYGAIGMLFALINKSKMPYVTLLRLAVVAVTPCIIIKTLLNVFGVTIPYVRLLYFLITIGYLFFGVRSVSKGDDSINEFAGNSGSGSL
jgi:hypothetical protein